MRAFLPRASGFSCVPSFGFKFSGTPLACRVVFIMCSTSQPFSENYLTVALCPPRPRHPFWPYPFRALSLVIQVCLYWIASLRVLQASEWDWLRFYRPGDFPLLLTPKTHFRSGSQWIISQGSFFFYLILETLGMVMNMGLRKGKLSELALSSDECEVLIVSFYQCSRVLQSTFICANFLLIVVLKAQCGDVHM